VVAAAESHPKPKDFEGALRLAILKFPKAIRYRALNAFGHLDRALILLPIDREMASFRGITGEEEAAAALFCALKLRKYPNSEKLSIWDHRQKAALIPFLWAVRANIGRGVENLDLTLDYLKPRLDVHLRGAELGVDIPGRNLRLTPVEPLNVLIMKQGSQGEPDSPDRFEDELNGVAQGAHFETIRAFVQAQANARNTLLYSSDSGLPESRVTEEGLTARKASVVGILLLTVAVLQTREHQALASRGIEVLLGIVGKLPSS